MNLLALTTSTPAVGVWLRTRGGFDAGATAVGEKGSAPALTGLLWALFARAGIVPADLDLVACDVGPGSFTGLRQGLCTARALAWAVQKPCAAIGSLQALVAEVRAGGTAGPVLVALRARRGVAYAGWSAAPGALDETVLDDADWPRWLAGRTRPGTPVTVCGAPFEQGATTYRTLVDCGLVVRASEAPPHPSARRVAELALSAPQVPALQLLPRYLLASEAEQRAGVEAAVEPLASART